MCSSEECSMKDDSNGVRASRMCRSFRLADSRRSSPRGSRLSRLRSAQPYAGRAGWPGCQGRAQSSMRLAGLIPESRQHFPAVELDNLLLVRLAGMNIDDGSAAVKEPLDRLHVRVGVGAHRPIAEDLRQRQFGLSTAFNL